MGLTHSFWTHTHLLVRHFMLPSQETRNCCCLGAGVLNSPRCALPSGQWQQATPHCRGHTCPPVSLNCVGAQTTRLSSAKSPRLRAKKRETLGFDCPCLYEQRRDGGGLAALSSSCATNGPRLGAFYLHLSPHCWQGGTKRGEQDGDKWGALHLPAIWLVCGCGGPSAAGCC